MNHAIPERLGDWTYEAVADLVTKGYAETDTFDFKGVLTAPPGSSNRARDKLRRKLAASVVAFANTRGGFLVFGVSENSQGGDPLTRISGIDESRELPKQFADQLGTIEPIPYFAPQNPRIAIPGSARVLFVVEIPSSPLAPHALRVPQQAGEDELLFHKRSQGRNSLMSYFELRAAFLGYDERRRKLNLLAVSLADIRDTLKGMRVPDHERFTKAPGLTPDTTLIDGLLPDLYTLLDDDPAVIKHLLEIRRGCALLRGRRESMELRLAVPAPQASYDNAVFGFNNSVLEVSVGMQPDLTAVLDYLESRYGITAPPL